MWALDVHLFVLSCLFVLCLCHSFISFHYLYFLNLFIYVYSFYVLLIFLSLFRDVICNFCVCLVFFFVFLSFTSMFFLLFGLFFRAILFPSALGMLILPSFFFLGMSLQRTFRFFLSSFVYREGTRGSNQIKLNYKPWTITLYLTTVTVYNKTINYIHNQQINYRWNTKQLGYSNCRIKSQ